MRSRSDRSGSPARRMCLAVVVLVAASGAVEALSFTALDHVFAGVMTSNLALLGMAAGQARGAGVRAAVLALGGFGAGTAMGAWATRGAEETDERWSAPVLYCLLGEAALLAAGAGAWAASGGTPGGVTRDVLQCGAAAAMGAQCAAMVAAGRAAAPTTYLTGTLATYIVRAPGSGPGRSDPWVPARFAALIAGAAAAVVLHQTAPAWAGVLPAALVAAAAQTAAGSWWTRR
ncbi:DUF1275 family protein [Streptomyces sp. NPDC090442]|uniref:DUF1275 family protein n=1 Tax=Streptomyces sp. NPDC090442 TaxID=3365962 RepID=UPI0037F1ADBA